MSLIGDFSQVELEEIAAQKSDNAVDVFVYDTSRDSDGGAWRKRTQHTSWYNETLNTSTRGGRREFPAVAVIVAENNKVTIYDGDDPALPMWMVFNAVSSKNTLLGYSTSFNNISITAGDGFIFVASNSGSTFTGGYQQVNFLTEVLFRMRHDVKRQSPFNISQRNNGFSDGEAIQTTDQVIASGLANNVAMTVLPGAPIDEATDLPVPTIAVATEEGVSVIKDDGTVVDLTSGSSASATARVVSFDDQNRVWFTAGYSGNNNYAATYYSEIPESDVFYGDISRTSNNENVFNGNTPVNLSAFPRNRNSQKNNGGIVATKDFYAFGMDSKLSILGSNANSQTGINAHVTSTYNTGYQNGDIKGAFLSDTDDTDLVGGELVTNGDFTNWTSDNPDGWSVDEDSGIDVTESSAGGQVRFVGDNSTATIWQSGILTPGKKYVIQVEMTESPGPGDLAVSTEANHAGSGIPQDTTKFINVGKNTYTLIAESDTFVIGRVFSSGPTIDATIDNVSVKLADNDRSANNNGLIINGTVTRSPVESGADLVAYSGFSSTNYLEQPYNPDLDFGTGDFCVMGWFKCPVNEGGLLLVRSSNTGGNGFYWYVGSSGIISTRTGSNGTPVERGTNETVDNNTWTQLVVLRKSGVIFRYLNGNLDSTFSQSGDIDTQEPLQLGGGDAAMALWRISATAPTDEQIRKIYEDEKFLFQDNAQATLYGNSDAVTALAYDDKKEQLHVGTSEGRSVFDGLRRIENTTTGVTTVISASNGLIAEQ